MSSTAPITFSNVPKEFGNKPDEADFLAFLSLFKGKDEISGSGEGYRLALRWLASDPDSFTKKTTTCLIFHEKPASFLITGTSKAGSGDGVAVNPALIQYLPSHDDDEDIPRNKRTGELWHAFRRVNFSMVRRVALLSLENEWLPKKHYDQWVDRYGGKPTKLDLEAPIFKAMAEETRRIRYQQLKQFRKDQHYWEPMIKDGSWRTSPGQAQREAIHSTGADQMDMSPIDTNRGRTTGAATPIPERSPKGDRSVLQKLTGAK